MSTNKDITTFLAKIATLIESEKLFKITFAKPRPGNKDIKNVYLKPAMIKNEPYYSLTFRYKTRDEARNFNETQVLSEAERLVTMLFFHAVLFTEEEEITLMQNKKGSSTLFTKKLKQELVISSSHDHQKERFISEDRPYLHLLGLASADGKIYDKSQKKYRQINKFIEIFDHLISDYPSTKLLRIADMGSGKGYLTFAMYDYLVNTKGIRSKIIGYELREDLVKTCYGIALKCDYPGLSFAQKSIDEADVRDTEVVIALHACDIATDMAIAKGIQSGARYIIVSPCCHKQVRKSMQHHNVLSPILAHGILEERQAEILTDGIRALLMEAHGYKTQVIEFISSEHTGKNLMITGVKGTTNAKALAEVEAIKKLFGIEYHYLETLLSNS